jgi:GxxExxY protein
MEIAMEFDELSSRVIEKAIEIHRILGPGMLESVYEQCLSYELTAAGIKHERQKEVPVVYKEITLDNGFRMDLFVENQLVVEIKSVEKILPVHEAQILTYMKFTGARTGLLINFNVKLLKEGLKRFVL